MHPSSPALLLRPFRPPAETLLLDLEAVVVLQNELQRLCLVAASLLVVQQVRASRRAGGIHQRVQSTQHLAALSQLAVCF